MSQECSYDVNDYKWTAECDGPVATITDIFDYKFEVIKFNNCKIEEKMWDSQYWLSYFVPFSAVKDIFKAI